MPYNFWVLIAIQFGIFLFFYFRNRGTSRDLLKVILLSASAGLVGGFLFDIIFGTLGVFTYHGTGQDTLVSGTGLSYKELLYNDILSYGLAVATARYIIPDIVLTKKIIAKKNALLILLGIFSTALTLSFIINFGIVALFVYGVAVISLGELVLALNNQSGLFLSLYMTHKHAHLIRLWSDIVVIAFLYELANYFYPFWVWLPELDYSYEVKEILIIVFGYAMLFHLMITFWQRVFVRK